MTDHDGLYVENTGGPHAYRHLREDPEGPDYFVATRIMPPWVPVQQEGAETDG